MTKLEKLQRELTVTVKDEKKAAEAVKTATGSETEHDAAERKLSFLRDKVAAIRQQIEAVAIEQATAEANDKNNQKKVRELRKTHEEKAGQALAAAKFYAQSLGLGNFARRIDDLINGPMWYNQKDPELANIAVAYKKGFVTDEPQVILLEQRMRQTPEQRATRIAATAINQAYQAAE